MSVQENKDLLVSFVKEVLDGKNLDAMDKYLSPNFLHHDLAPGEQTRQQTGAAGQRNFFSNVVFPAFDNFNTTFEDLVGENDLVAGRWRQSSRNSGPWLGRRPTGKRTEIAGVSIVRIRNGLIVEEWEGRDAAGLFRQLGVPVPKPRLKPVRLPLGPAVVGIPPFRTNGPFGRPASPNVRRAKAQAASVYLEAWNNGNLDALGKNLSDRFVLHDPSGLPTADRSGSAALVSAFRTGLPDLGVTVDLQLAEGDLVVNRWTARGSHDGELLGVPSTGRRVSFTGVSIQQIGGDKIEQEWALWEQLSVFQQVGALKF